MFWLLSCLKVFLIIVPAGLRNSVDGLSVRKDGKNEETLIFAKNEQQNTGKILKHTEVNGKNRWHVLFETEKNSVVDSVQFNKDHIVVSSFWGPSIKNKILDYDGRTLFEIPTPGCCAFHKLNSLRIWILPLFTSAVISNSPFLLNIQSKKSAS